MRHATHDHLVYVSTLNTTGILAVNRPKALNSLNLAMVETITNALDAWRDDDSIHRVVITSTSEKAFCAGGDVRAAREGILAGNSDAVDQYFNEEYEMNAALSAFPKPIVAVIDGIVMGGGLGISMHGSHRVITEHATAAMPEMLIGFIPDVGSTYMLPRMAGPGGTPSLAVAQFITLTGYRMSAADMLYSGLATDFVASSDVMAFIDMVVAESLDEALEHYAGPRPTDSWMKTHRDAIEEVFGEQEFATIIDNLNRCDDHEFVTTVRELIESANPTSLVAATLLTAANATVSSVRHALDNEFVVAATLIRSPNFAEGVRAVLVDKTRDATFSPATVAEVDPAPFHELLSTN
ncbi:3-hydroxyisobutyryl-CoA hydrolase [Corynebacterium choanae]|uniref:3-hydroxyisobutyryl-CoA hydrolase n=1 Tax=Corynebacterium choanae TaxID=1862358 RepID=A0A3G6J5U2_9CORY|nr:3-hydroxyisobutyryl-CoA hydrolase [Corynebacterium choanae]AZA13133.1 Carnitinyl-CoA dehydratase [Corynebacterium choanae]